MNTERLDHLLRQYFDGGITGNEIAELDAALHTRPEARERFWKEAHVHGALREWGLESGSAIELRAMTSVAAEKPVRRERSRWLPSSPLAAAAAGLAFGLLCASVAWAISTPRPMATASRLFALMDGGFESVAVSAGFPKQVGAWSGDASEVVVAEAVKAWEGQRMLRFVKAEGDATAPDGRAMACDVFQLVDLRPLRASLGADGDSLLELSASFLDARPANTKPSVTFFCQLFLFKGDADRVHQTWPNNISEAIASGSAQVTTLGGNGSAWKQLTAKSLVSAEADFAVVQISARPNLRVPMPPQLFVDDVKLTLKTQPTLPVRVVQR